MKITNKNNLPEALIKALTNDPYDRGLADYTVTELLEPPRKLALQRKLRDQIEEDAADLVYRLYGQIAHSILERANQNDLSEKRFSSIFEGKVVSGKIDSLSKDGVLIDYKFCTVWKFKQSQPPDPEFVAQLNMYLELLRRNGHDAKKLQVLGLIRDYRITERDANPDSYPRTNIVILPIPMWPRPITTAYIKTRIRLHEEAKLALPDCSKDERWAKDDIHAVMKGRRAINGGLKASHQEALEMHKLNPGTRVEFRPAVSTRCELYCSVRNFCEQFQKMKGGI